MHSKTTEDRSLDPIVGYRLNKKKSEQPQNVNVFLFLCCMTVSLGSFQFGYNMASLNPCTDLIKQFIRTNSFLFSGFNHQQADYLLMREQFKANTTIYNFVISTHHYVNLCLEDEVVDYCSDRKFLRDFKQYNQTLSRANLTFDEYVSEMSRVLTDEQSKLDKRSKEMENEARQVVTKWTNALWAITHTIFSVGGMIGALCSKYFMDWMGRKGAYLFHNLFGIAGALCVLAAPYTRSPVLLMIARLLYGIQSGSICSIAPTFLNEISHVSVRGRIGVMPQLNIVFGVLLAQIFGLSHLLGEPHLWHYMVALPIIPALIGNICMYLFFPETPLELLSTNEHEAKLALQKYRNSQHVNQELAEMQEALRASASSRPLSIKAVLTLDEIRWPLIVAVTLQIAQQLSGINALFYYSADIFKSAGIPLDQIQYAILSTGIVRVLLTFLVIPLIDRLGRKWLIVLPTAVMIATYSVLVLSLSFKDRSLVFPYMSVVCILILIMQFAIGHGPIPFIYAAECFKKNQRSSAMAVCVAINWASNVLLTLVFPFLIQEIGHFIFLVFASILTFTLIIIFPKMKETKGRSTEEIVASFNK